MKDINKVLKALQKKGFELVHGNGSRAKLYPPVKSMPFYSLHLDNSGNAFYPLKRFAMKEWHIDLNNL